MIFDDLSNFRVAPIHPRAKLSISVLWNAGNILSKDVDALKTRFPALWMPVQIWNGASMKGEIHRSEKFIQSSCDQDLEDFQWFFDYFSKFNKL